MGYILASGCSYTDQNYKIETPDLNATKLPITWDAWPAIIAKRHNKKCVNLARSGQSNKFIFDSLYDYILKAKEPPDEVYIMLTGWDRIQILNKSLITAVYIQVQKTQYDLAVNKESNPTHFMHLIRLEQQTNDTAYKSIALDLLSSQITVDMLIDNTLMSMFIFCEFCINRGIQVSVGQGVNPWLFGEFTKDFEFRSTIKFKQDLCNMNMVNINILDNFYFNKIDNLIDGGKIFAPGWPFLRDIGGLGADDIRSMNDRSLHSISEYDSHPNASGHELFANYMMGKIV